MEDDERRDCKFSAANLAEYFKKDVDPRKLTLLAESLDAHAKNFRCSHSNGFGNQQDLSEAIGYLKSFLDTECCEHSVLPIDYLKYIGTPYDQIGDQTIALTQEQLVVIAKKLMANLIRNGTGLSVKGFVRRRTQQSNTPKPQILFLMQVLTSLRALKLSPKSKNRFAAYLCHDGLGLYVGIERKGDYTTVRGWLKEAEELLKPSSNSDESTSRTLSPDDNDFYP